MDSPQKAPQKTKPRYVLPPQAAPPTTPQRVAVTANAIKKPPAAQDENPKA